MAGGISSGENNGERRRVSNINEAASKTA